MIAEVRDFAIRYGDAPTCVDGLDIAIHEGDRIGIAGESGCGKTSLIRALMGLLPFAAVTSGSIRIHGSAAYIPQEALLSLSPYRTVGLQVADIAGSASEARRILASVGLAGERYAGAYPHQLSGGERQRVLAAQAFAQRPRLIVADEPTAGLDEQNESLLLNLLDSWSRETGGAILVASHRERVFDKLNCRVIRLTPLVEETVVPFSLRHPAPVLLSARGLRKTWSGRDWLLRSRPRCEALRGADFEIGAGEFVALTGPSGAGKSTLAACVADRTQPDSGEIRWHSRDAGPGRGRVQTVEQEPSGTLNPRLRIAQVVREADSSCPPEALIEVGLPPEWWARKASELSEGQRARVAILRAARALRGDSALLILDESLSGLDPATTSSILGYLNRLRAQRGLSILLIAHDHQSAQMAGARLVRMENGRIAA